MPAAPVLVPPWSVASWLNVADPHEAPDVSGRVVVTGAFQMLCPGCVEHCIPQLRNVAATFGGGEVAVLGLHTVFEHHEAMTPVALKAFLHEYRVTFPVAVDAPDPGGLPVPVTMGSHRMRGTPTLLLHDRSGQLRSQRFGHVPDLQLGAEITRLLLEDVPPRPEEVTGAGCTDLGCTVG